MSQQPVGGAIAPPEVIYIIRHGEKPADPPPVDPGQPPPTPAAPFGVGYQGIQDEHSLLPRGWQRSGALAVLFAPALGAPQGLSDRLGLQITSDFAEGQESQLIASVVSTYSGVVLICWEHQHIPALASSVPAIPGTAIPQKWPGDRFDVIWTFTLVPGAAPAQYTFGQIPERLLSGDMSTVIQP